MAHTTKSLSEVGLNCHVTLTAATASPPPPSEPPR